MIVNVTTEASNFWTFDKRARVKALGAASKPVIKAARALVSKKGASQPGDYPGLQTGRLRRSIGIVKRGNRGGYVRVGPRTMRGSAFYPVFLYYGTRTLNAKGAAFAETGTGRKIWRARTRKLTRRIIETVSDQRIAPRDNYMEDALIESESVARSALRVFLFEGIKP